MTIKKKAVIKLNSMKYSLNLKTFLNKKVVFLILGIVLLFSSPLISNDMGKFRGLCYGPFREGENPDCGIFPTTKELAQDIEFISKITNNIRVYGMSKTLKNVPELCENFGIDCYPGAWLSKYKRENRREINTLIEIGKQKIPSVKGLIVGNEVLLRKDLSEEELLASIRKVKKQTNLPVTTAEIWSILLKNPEIVKEIDFILVHIHPYWEGMKVDKAAEYVIEKWEELKRFFPDKEIIIGETGWPTSGKRIREAVTSEENQFIFLSKFLRLAKEKKVKYFYFEVFDEKWKEKFEGGAGSSWGMYYSDGSLKPLLKELFPVAAQKGINRPKKVLETISVSSPVTIWTETDFSENHFFPTGWMGDLEAISLDDNCSESPFSGRTCIKIIYSPKRFDSWAGVYFQYPMNNWGDYPGYDISGASKLTFWARGENGGEKAEFKAGGIKDRTKPERDSFGPISTGIVKLSKDWKQYALNLKGQDLRNVIGGFCWVTNRFQNPKGCTIYVDDIKFE